MENKTIELETEIKKLTKEIMMIKWQLNFIALGLTIISLVVIWKLFF